MIRANWDVLHDSGIGQDPARARGRLTRAVRTALEGVDDPEAKAALDELE